MSAKLSQVSRWAGLVSLESHIHGQCPFFARKWRHGHKRMKKDSDMKC